MKSETLPRVYSVAQVSCYLKISRATVRELHERGELVGFKCGRFLKFRESVILDYVGGGGEVKPKEKKPEFVFRIIDRLNGEAIGSYSRAYGDEFDFDSPSEARAANCHGIFEDRKKYKIAKYKVTYELIEDDCDK